MIQVEDQKVINLNNSKAQIQNIMKKELQHRISKVQSKSDILDGNTSKNNAACVPKSKESNQENSGMAQNVYDDQTIEISNMDISSINGSVIRFNMTNNLGRNTSVKYPLVDSDTTSPLNVYSSSQPKEQNSWMDGSIKIFNDNPNYNKQALNLRSPMSVSDAKIKDKYDFQQYVQPENEVEISDSDTEKNKEITKKAKNRQWSLLTPQNKITYNEQQIAPATFLGTERRSEISRTSSQNIFNRGSRAGLSRKDSIFTHVTRDVNITCDPSTGEKQLNQYILMKEIGKGSYAEVWLGYNIIDKQKYAVKIITLTKLRRILTSKTTTAVDSLKTEIVIMKKLNHKHLVKLYEVLGEKENDKIYIVTEYMKNGSLAALMNKQKLSIELIWFYFRQIILGIEYCHVVAKICHRDIKPENMLLGEEINYKSNHAVSKFKTHRSSEQLSNNTYYNLKIADFGLSSIIENGNDSLKNTVGSNFYFSPELSKGSTYKGISSDIWACGVTLYQMIHNKYPFKGRTFPELYNNIQNSEPEYDKNITAELLELLKGILEKDPDKRFTIQQIKENKWFTKDGTEPCEDLNLNDKIKLSLNDYKKAFGKISVCKQRKVRFQANK